MWRKTCLTDHLKLQNPVVLAPMAGVSTPKLVAAVTNSGGLGMYGAALTPAKDMPALVESIRSLLHNPALPFGFNLFCPPTHIPEHTSQQQRALDTVHKVYADLATKHNLSCDVQQLPPPDAAELHLAFRAQVQVCWQHHAHGVAKPAQNS
jgi:NAD(P)H-dependent flavin oxidoreductase YrpB (nitropropane dioxygenase family)